MSADACLYLGEVVHVRSRPRRHRLNYHVFSMLFDLDGLSNFDQYSRLFSLNRFNLFSFYDRDHGDGKTPLRSWVEAQLCSAGIELQGGTIRLLCYPRLLGYVFNPISVYFCYYADHKLAAILYEVDNTFGQRHTYLFAISTPLPGVLRHSCKKRLYVSPFVGMDTWYEFRITPPDERMVLTIAEADTEGTLLQASFVGHRESANDRQLIRAFFRYPLMTLKVILGIHLEAIKLLWKGIKFHGKPAAPTEQVTIIVDPEQSP